MNIVDLRQTAVRQLEPLLDEEARHWREELHWDYRGALELIKRFLEARALAGCVAFENRVAAGYCFYVLEEQKGLIGGLYVSPRYDQATVGRRLLEELLFGMRALPQLNRIEAQLMPFGGPGGGAAQGAGLPPPPPPIHAPRFAVFPGANRVPLRRNAPRPLARPLLRSLRQVNLSFLRQSRGRRNQRPISQPFRRAAFLEKHHPASRLRSVCPQRLVRPAPGRRRRAH